MKKEIMKNKLRLLFGLLALLVGCSPAFAQSVTFTEHVAPILYRNCISCHRPAGTAPFSLLTYPDVARRASFVQHVTERRIMPPWKANPHFRSFANEKRLTDAEIKTIQAWVQGGALQGPAKAMPALPPFVSQSELPEQPDLVLKMREPFRIKGNNKETYICYKIPYELPADTYARAIEFIPGNRKVVHHVSYQILGVAEEVDLYNSPDYFVFQDTDFINDEHDYGYFNLYSKTGQPPVQTYHDGWLPGTSPHVYPEGIGFKLPKKGVVLIRNLHYGPSPIDQEDQSSVHIYFSPKPAERTIMFTTFRPNGLDFSKDNLLPADTVVKYHMNIKLDADVSLLNINPHMHLLGKYFKAVAVPPAGDTIPLIEINEWDFNWQEFYRFKKMLKIPRGSVIYAEAIFDNTAQNPNNPQIPPQPVYFERGMDDKDEMMRLTFLFLPYRPGDENIDLENLWEKALPK